MELIKTAKLQIYTSDSEKNLLFESMRAYADACNFISHYIYTTKDLSQHFSEKTGMTCRTILVASSNLDSCFFHIR